MTFAVLDDHLLRDFLAEDVPAALAEVLDELAPATTNLYLVRLCKSAVSARGGRLTGAWAADRRRALAEALVRLPDRVQVVPMRSLAFRMAQLADAHRVSTLGAEAVAAAEELGGPLCVWEGDDGPGIRACASARDVDYRALSR